MKKFVLLATIALLLAGCATTPTAPATTAPTATATRRPTLAPTATATYAPYTGFLDKPADSVRVVSYNVNWDSIFPPDDPKNHELREFDRQAAFKRIMLALQPDVLCLQEINYLRGTQAMEDFFNQLFGGSESWQVVKERDTLVASRFPLRSKGYELVTNSIRPDLPQAAALVDLPDGEYGVRDLYMVCSHFKASSGRDDILERLRQADVIMAHMHDAITPGGNLDLPSGTPFVLLGDYNVYESDPHLQLRTLIKGDIYDEKKYGADFQPDWDGTSLTDAQPSLDGLGRDYYTWRDDSSSFAPGAFDHIIYSDSVLGIENEFVLDTSQLAPEILAQYGLQAGDVLLDASTGYYDHYPLVADFAILN